MLEPNVAFLLALSLFNALFCIREISLGNKVFGLIVAFSSAAALYFALSLS